MILVRAMTVLSLVAAALGVTLFNGWIIAGSLVSAAVFGGVAMTWRIRRRRAAGQPWMVPRISGRRGNTLAALAVIAGTGAVIGLARVFGW